MMRSCLSSQRLKKDVIDSLRPSRRNGVRNAIPEKRKVVQPSCGVQLLPLPKPEDTIEEHDANQSPLYLHRSARYFEEDDQLVRIQGRQGRLHSVFRLHPFRPLHHRANARQQLRQGLCARTW